LTALHRRSPFDRARSGHGFLVVWLPLNRHGFRPVWHDQLDASFAYWHVGQVGLVETARWAAGALFALVGILWIISSVLGTVNYLFLGFGIVWLLGSVCWPLGILTHRRRQRAAEEKGRGQ
jgi:hypothetical protein